MGESERSGRSVGSFIRDVRSVLRYFGRLEWTVVALVFVLTVAQVYLDLRIPEYMASITETLVNHGSTDLVMVDAWSMVKCALASLAMGMCITLLIGVVSSRYSMRLREIQFERVQGFSMEEMGRFSTYSLITRSTNDIKQIQDFIGISLESLMRAPVVCGLALFKISCSDLSWTAVTVVAVGLMLVLVGCILRRTIPGFRRVQRLTDGVNRVSAELIDGIRVIRAYNAEGFERGRFSEANGELTRNNLGVYRVMAFNVPFNALIRNSLTMAIYWVGAFTIAGTAGYEARLTLFSDMIVFATYSVMILNGFRTLTQMFNLMPRATVASQRIAEVIDTVPSIVGGPSHGDPAHDVAVSFRDVSFRYPGAGSDTLSGITFDVGRGETVAVIGSTGSGKTTLVNLIPRFYDATGGSVEVMGTPIGDLDLDALRGNIGFVSQDNSVLSGTVRSNVSYGSASSSDESVTDALRTARADTFVEDMGGLDSRIEERGRNLSGGQKQRISIARAVHKSPGIFVFDDSFSALDFRTDRDVRSALRERFPDATVIVVAQRIGTVIGSDRIVVLDGGRIAGIGTHDELMSSCTVYREIAESQIEGAE
ncbi:MAG: ABC transporter ATP-binding protein [Candidatus Methanomethylophilaceae archaeon]|nr:ABC transporter ATP-binding protein [Candidatus Methanomethylophilaceae archaeon]